MIHVTTFSLQIVTREKHTGSKSHGIKTEPFCHQRILGWINRPIHYNAKIYMSCQDCVLQLIWRCL